MKNGMWQRVEDYFKLHPEATATEVSKALKAKIQNVTNAMYGLRQKGSKYVPPAKKQAKAQKMVTGAEGLVQFKKSRRSISNPIPFRMEVNVDERGVELSVQNCERKIGTMELTTKGVVFRRGKTARVNEGEISWELLAMLAGVIH